MSKIKLATFVIPLAGIFSNAFCGTILPDPISLDDYIRTADLIVVGNIANVDKVHNFYGYQSDALDREENEKKLLREGKRPAFSLGVPMIDFNIHPHEIIKNNDNDVNELKFIVYRKYMEGGAVIASINGKDISGRYIFFLNKNPDNKTYGIRSASREIGLNNFGEALTYKAHGEDKTILAGEFDGNNFIQLVKDHVLKLKSKESK